MWGQMRACSHGEVKNQDRCQPATEPLMSLADLSHAIAEGVKGPHPPAYINI